VTGARTSLAKIIIAVWLSDTADGGGGTEKMAALYTSV
jgi:hypothetical protein